jgi:hypothetical protein
MKQIYFVVAISVVVVAGAGAGVVVQLTIINYTVFLNIAHDIDKMILFSIIRTFKLPSQHVTFIAIQINL